MSSGGEMSSGQLLQQMALLQWLSSQTDEDRSLLTAVTGIRVARELLDRFTGQNEVDSYKVSACCCLQEVPIRSESL
ncbi:hypothetical protein PAMP_021685 [Pampus punctatissimus]